MFYQQYWFFSILDYTQKTFLLVYGIVYLYVVPRLYNYQYINNDSLFALSRINLIIVPVRK